MNYHISISKIRTKQENVVRKAQKLGHTLLYSEYGEQLANLSFEEIIANKAKIRFQSERKAILQFRCESHPDAKIQETTVYKYLNARCGLPCCGCKQVSQKLKGRSFSDETLKKMAESQKIRAQKNPSRTESAIEKEHYVKWRQAVLKNGNYLCAITQVKSKELHVHHLYSKKVFPSLKHEPENGLVLDAQIHQYFHNKVGSLIAVTPDHFIEFLQDLIDSEEFRMKVFQKVTPRKKYPTYVEQISNKLSFSNNASSLAGKEDKCSETSTYYDIENICKLLQNVTELKTSLFSKLTEEEKELAIQASREPLVARYFKTNMSTESDEES